MKVNKVVGSGLAVLAAAFTLTACSGGSNDSGNAAAAPTTSASAAPASTAGARNGTFKGDSGKNVAGTVSIADGKVTLSGFSSDAGPDLHIYLTDGATESDVAAGKQLGTVAYDQASQTFTLGGADASKYNTVVIHCDKAKAVFGDAPLS